MKKRMCKVLAAAIVLSTVFTGCAQNSQELPSDLPPLQTESVTPAPGDDGTEAEPEQNALSKQELDQKAAQFIELIRAENFASAHEMFEANYAEQFPVEQLQASWQDILSKAGAFSNIGKQSDSNQMGYTLYTFKDDYANNGIASTVIFDSFGNVVQVSFESCAKTVQSDATDLPEGVAEDNVTVGKGTDYELNAKITYPKNISGEIPAVVLVPCSGVNDMDETTSSLKMFKDLAYGLASRGVAVIRHDSRTFSYQQEIFADYEKSATFDVDQEFIQDAISAKDVLLNKANFKISKVFVLGHQFGGMLAPRIASEGNFDGIIVMAGSPRSFIDVLYSYYKYMFSTGEMPPEQVTEYLKMVEDEWSMAKGTATPPAEGEEGASPELSDPVKIKGVMGLSDEELLSTSYFGMSAYYLKSFESKPTADYFKDLAKPVLILQGAKDVQMSVEDDFNAYKAITTTAKDVTMKLYDTLNYFFVQSTMDPPSYLEYDIPAHVPDEVTTDIAQWMLSK